MTDAQILAIAYGFEQYPGAKEPTLRGQAIVEFARALLSEPCADGLEAPSAQPVGWEWPSRPTPFESPEEFLDPAPTLEHAYAEGRKDEREALAEPLPAAAIFRIKKQADADGLDVVGFAWRIQKAVAAARAAPETKPRTEFAEHYSPPGATSSAAAPKESAS